MTKESKIIEEKEKVTADPYENTKTDWSEMLLRKKMTIANYRINMIPKKKSGHNDKLDYYYFKLGDIMPAILKVCAEMGIFHRTFIDENQLKLVIQNADKPDDEEFVYGINLKSFSLMGHNPMQEQGAAITYARRGLYTMVFDIEDEDELDLVQGTSYNDYQQPMYNNVASKPVQPQKMSSKQDELIKKLFKVLFNDPEYKDSAAKVLKQFGLSNLAKLNKYLDYDKAQKAIADLNEIYQSKKAHDKEAQENIVVDNETGEVKIDEAKTVAEPKKTVVQKADSNEENVEEIELGGDNENIDDEEITIIDVDEIEGIEAFN